MALTRRSIITASIVLLCLGVGEFWFHAANRLGYYVNQPLLGGKPLADLCDGNDTTGFPFRLKLSCNKLTLPLRVGDSLYYVDAHDAQGVASLFSPNHVLLTLSSPIVVRKADGSPFATLRHDGMTLDAVWGLAGLRQIRLDAAALDWRPESPAAGVAVNVQKLAASAGPQGDPNAPSSLRFDLSGDGITAPALQALLNSAAAGHFAASGDITPAPRLGEDWRAALDHWRRKPGSVTIQTMEWQAGDVSLRLDGALAIDDAHRAVGRLNLTAQGAGALLVRFGVPSSSAQTQNLLGALLGSGAGAKGNANQGDAKALRLPLTLVNGQVFVGPFRLPQKLQPLY
jgi:hypothetical protein